MVSEIVGAGLGGISGIFIGLGLCFLYWRSTGYDVKKWWGPVSLIVGLVMFCVSVI